jgi:hypothetical protein
MRFNYAFNNFCDELLRKRLGNNSKTDFLKNKISRNAHEFDEKNLLINNVKNRYKVEK